MKKVLLSIVLAFGFVCAVQADTYVYSLAITNNQPISYSDPLPISGILEKVEIAQSNSSDATNTFTVATYSGTTAVDTYVSASSLAGNKVYRPRFIGTGNTGTDIAAAGGNNTNTLTQLNALYEKAMIGGNVKVAVTAVGLTGTCTSSVTIFFTPVKK